MQSCSVFGSVLPPPNLRDLRDLSTRGVLVIIIGRRTATPRRSVPNMALLASAHLNSLVRNVLQQFVEIPESDDSIRFFGSGGSVIQLRDVALKEAPLASLNLPFRLKSSRVGTFRLKMRLHSVMFLV